MTGIKNEQINIIPILISSMKKIKQSKVLERERDKKVFTLYVGWIGKIFLREEDLNNEKKFI